MISLINEKLTNLLTNEKKEEDSIRKLKGRLILKRKNKRIWSEIGN